MGKSNNFSGFLDGYKAQNLANVADTASFHWQVIREQVNILESLNGKQLSSLKRVVENDFAVRQLQLGGEAIKALLSIALSQKDTNLLASPNIKTLIYHYFEAAEATADSASLRTAMDIGEMFKKINIG